MKAHLNSGTRPPYMLGRIRPGRLSAVFSEELPSQPAARYRLAGHCCLLTHNAEAKEPILRSTSDCLPCATCRSVNAAGRPSAARAGAAARTRSPAIPGTGGGMPCGRSAPGAHPGVPGSAPGPLQLPPASGKEAARTRGQGRPAGPSGAGRPGPPSPPCQGAGRRALSAAGGGVPRDSPVTQSGHQLLPSASLSPQKSAKMGRPW